MGVSKNGGTPKWMIYNGKPYDQMDDLGGKPTILGNIPILGKKIFFGHKNPYSLIAIISPDFVGIAGPVFFPKKGIETAQNTWKYLKMSIHLKCFKDFQLTNPVWTLIFTVIACSQLFLYQKWI